MKLTMEYYGTETKIISTKYAATHLSTVQLTDNKILLGHSYDSSYYLAGSIITIDENNNLTLKKDKNLLYEDNTKSSSYDIKMIKLNENNVIIINSIGNNDSKLLSCAKLIISDDDMILGKCTVVSSYITYNYKVSSLIENNKFMIIGCASNSYSLLYGTVVKIDNNITAGTNILLSSIEGSGYYGNFITLKNNNLLIGYIDSNKNLYGIFGKLDNNIDKIKSNNNILGISKTIGTDGETVQVYVPSIEEEEN